MRKSKEGKEKMFQQSFFGRSHSLLKDKLDENRQHPRKFWNTINQHILGKDDNSSVSEIVGNDGTTLSGAYAASFMNNLYANMGKDIHKNINIE